MVITSTEKTRLLSWNKQKNYITSMATTKTYCSLYCYETTRSYVTEITARFGPLGFCNKLKIHFLGKERCPESPLDTSRRIQPNAVGAADRENIPKTVSIYPKNSARAARKTIL